jgi:hypothetical protein
MPDPTAKLSPALVTKNHAYVRFSYEQDHSTQLVVERNVGQASFEDEPEAFLLLDMDGGERSWYLHRSDAIALLNWLAVVLNASVCQGSEGRVV